eukprot:35139-Chlamydomonas_euryale.AAC.5
MSTSTGGEHAWLGSYIDAHDITMDDTPSINTFGTGHHHGQNIKTVWSRCTGHSSIMPVAISWEPSIARMARRSVMRACRLQTQPGCTHVHPCTCTEICTISTRLEQQIYALACAAWAGSQPGDSHSPASASLAVSTFLLARRGISTFRSVMVRRLKLSILRVMSGASTSALRNGTPRCASTPQALDPGSHAWPFRRTRPQ